MATLGTPSSKAGSTHITEEPASKRIYGFQEWNITVTFNNENGTKISINPEAILQLVIEDDLLHWPYRGYLTIRNDAHAFERASSETQGAKSLGASVKSTVALDAKGSIKNMTDTLEAVDVYTWRMDGYDSLTISLNPVVSDESEAESERPDAIWKFADAYTVYDTEDILTSNAISKIKRIYFWDERYQLLQNANIPWSTSSVDSNPNLKDKVPSQASDNDRSMFTGDAIKGILTAAGFEGNIDEAQFEPGGTKILYTSPTQNSAMDDINYILQRHMWVGGPDKGLSDICIFKLDRHTKKWTLLPLHKYFDQAGNSSDSPGALQLEHLFFEEINAEAGASGGTNPWYSPYSLTDGFERDIKLKEWNRITAYQFVEMSGIDNSIALASNPVHHYNYDSKQFTIDFEENEISSVREDFDNMYVKKLYAAEGENYLFVLNKLKANQISINHKYDSSNIDDKRSRSRLGKGEALFAGLFLNEQLILRLVGSTHRLAGTFIGVDRDNVFSANEFDYKLCGQWFVTKVKHIFSTNSYHNEVTAVKIHSHKKIDVNEKNTPVIADGVIEQLSGKS